MDLNISITVLDVSSIEESIKETSFFVSKLTQFTRQGSTQQTMNLNK